MPQDTPTRAQIAELLTAIIHGIQLAQPLATQYAAIMAAITAFDRGDV